MTTTTQGNTVTVSLNRSAPPPITASPQVVAIPNNLNAQNKPYPVQESVTIVPLLQPQAPAQYPMNPQPMNINYPPGPAFPQNFGKVFQERCLNSNDTIEYYCRCLQITETII